MGQCEQSQFAAAVPSVVLLKLFLGFFLLVLMVQSKERDRVGLRRRWLG